MRALSNSKSHLRIITNEACVHGASRDQVAGYSCDCDLSFEGPNCDLNIDDCELAPCKNNGTWLDMIGAYLCMCRPGFEGKQCEQDVNECQSNPCYHNATCQDQENHHECICPAGYQGER